MAVVGSDGVFVGTVDRVQGDYIKLTQGDDDDKEHHYIDLPWVAHVDDKVHLVHGRPGQAGLGTRVLTAGPEAGPAPDPYRPACAGSPLPRGAD